MKQKVSTKSRSTNSTVRSLLRGFGRVAIWSVLGLLLIRGALAGPSDSGSVKVRDAAGVDPASAAFAVRFARAYLSDPSAQALDSFLAEGARVGTGRPPRDGAGVVQAEVSQTKELGDEKSILTVACTLRDARTLYLAVPIVREEAGEVAALGAPSIVAAPGVTRADSGERPQSLAGPGAGAIGDLVAKFLPAYLTATDAGALSYLLVPDAEVNPLGGAVALVSVSGISQLGSGEGPRRSVLAAARVSDPASGAVYPVVYRLELVQRGRWYVESVEGASA